MNYKIYCDGGARGNPGPAASAFIVFEGDKKIHQNSKYLDVNTNNFAEYTAVDIALDWLIKNSSTVKEVNFYLDSELVVKQLTGVYKIKSDTLMPLAIAINKKIKELNIPIKFNNIPRKDNEEADKLVNITLDSSH